MGLLVGRLVNGRRSGMHSRGNFCQKVSDDPLVFWLRNVRTGVSDVWASFQNFLPGIITRFRVFIGFFLIFSPIQLDGVEFGLERVGGFQGSSLAVENRGRWLAEAGLESFVGKSVYSTLIGQWGLDYFLSDVALSTWKILKQKKYFLKFFRKIFNKKDKKN